ncbi:hypothetical protein RUND412_002270 [Rhizina undulata]
MSHSDWSSLAAEAQSHRQSSIPPEWRIPLSRLPPEDVLDVSNYPRIEGLLTARELEITERYDAIRLLEGMREGALKSREVVEAFCKRAAIAQQLTNCLTHMFFEKALERAEFLDHHFAKHGKPYGPLHGLPISLKDTFALPPFASTVGLTSLSTTPATAPAALVQLLLDAGAVLYVKTTTPQAQLSLDTVSPLWGRTLNPLNRMLTSGGSSGGEAALMAMRGSILGLGTDMGGSIRIPAACCKLVAFKPSSGRLPASGTDAGRIPGEAEVGVSGVVGVLARCLSDVRMFMEVIRWMEAWRYDSTVVPWPLEKNHSKPHRPLRIGFLHSDGIVTPLPPVSRAMAEVEMTLLRAGHNVITVDLPQRLLPEAYATLNAYFALSGSEHLFTTLGSAGDEPLSPWLAARMKRPAPPKELKDLWKLNSRRRIISTTLSQAIWGPSGAMGGEAAGGLDVLVMPVAPHMTPGHDEWGGVSYTGIWNLVDWPSGVLPVRNVKASDLEADFTSAMDEPGNKWEAENRELWRPERRGMYLDAPMGIQIVGRKWMEADLLESMAVIQDVIWKGEEEGRRKRLSVKL